VEAARAVATPAALIVIVVVIVVVGSSLGSPGLQAACITFAVAIVLVVGLYTFVGPTGIVSFAHAGFMAIGAYVGAILVSPKSQKALFMTGMPHPLLNAHAAATPAILAGGAAAAVVAAIVSVPLMRVTGFIASLATFAVLQVTQSVASNWNSVTGGVRGYQVAPILTSSGRALIWAVVAIVIGFIFSQSRVGVRLAASREDEIAARGVGINVPHSRRAAFVVSAFLAGIAGALTGLQLGVFTPNLFYLDAAFLMIIMLVVGGRNSLSGAVIGCVLISAITYVLQLAQGGDVIGLFHFSGRSGIEDAGIALVALYTLLRRPDGIMGATELGELLIRVGRARTVTGRRRGRDSGSTPREVAGNQEEAHQPIGSKHK
jgi:branched-chain amino acid transport system permease protein